MIKDTDGLECTEEIDPPAGDATDGGMLDAVKDSAGVALFEIGLGALFGSLLG